MESAGSDSFFTLLHTAVKNDHGRDGRMHATVMAKRSQSNSKTAQVPPIPQMLHDLSCLLGIRAERLNVEVATRGSLADPVRSL